MKIKFAFLFLVSIIFASATALARDKTIRIVTSIPPLASVAREIVGDRSRIDTLINNSVEPSLFELPSSDSRILWKSELVLLVGDGFEPWAANIDPKKVLTLKDSLDQYYTRIPGNNNYWVDPTAMIYFAKSLANRIISLRPKRAADIETRLKTFEEKIMALDKDITQQVRVWRHKKFFSIAPYWSYFALRFGLEELGSLKNIQDKGGNTKTLADLLGGSKKTPVRIIFKEIRDKDDLLSGFIDDSSVRKITLDAIGRADEDYSNLILRNVTEMAQQMGK